jgi:hypothetical protein
MGLELGVGAEQLGTAGAAGVDPLGLRVGVLTGERPLGAGLAKYLELLGAELLAPLVVGQLQLGSRCGQGSTLAQLGGATLASAGE